ncbi:MAG: hypothetical protein IJW43_00135 [Clostridia bacterium]|nr:hypothetical protein [Clostridia bacterium]
MKFKIILSILLSVCIIFTFTFGNKKINEKKGLIELESVSEILTLWHVDTFEGGTGSRKQFLSKVVREFEKKYKSVLIYVVEKTPESIKEDFSKNIYPDMLSFGNGISVNNLVELDVKLDYNFTKFGDKVLAVPWCRGGYCLIENPNFNKKQGGNICSVSQGKFNLPLCNVLDSNLEIKINSQFNAYLEFVNLKSRYLLGTQRDIVRLTNRNFSFTCTPLEYFNDLYQYVSVIDSGKSKTKISKLFVDFLLSEKIQKRLTEIDMISCFFDLEYQNENMKNLQKIKNLKSVSFLTEPKILLELQALSLKAANKDQSSILNLKKFII